MFFERKGAMVKSHKNRFSSEIGSAIGPVVGHMTFQVRFWRTPQKHIKVHNEPTTKLEFDIYDILNHHICKCTVTTVFHNEPSLNHCKKSHNNLRDKQTPW